MIKLKEFILFLIVMFFFTLFIAAIILLIIWAYKKSTNPNNSQQIQQNNIQQEQRAINNQNVYYSANSIQNQKQQPNNQNYPYQQTNQAQATTNTNKPKSNYLPYHRKYLLTKREYGFYKKLKPIADKYNLQVLAKIRFADLVEVDENVNPNYKQTWFYKIQAKHIDFAIADEMKIIALLELDDSTHSQADRIERDEFVNAVTKKCGYILIHTYGELENIENEMRKYRKSTLKAIS